MIPDSYHIYHSKYGQEFKSYSDNFEEWIEDVCEPPTWNEFWSKNKNILHTLFSEEIDMKQVYKLISDTIKTIYETSKTRKITLLGDNPAYDYSRIDYALEKYCDELPIRFSNREKITKMRETNPTSEGYNSIKDPTERMKYHVDKDLVDRLSKLMSKHTHLPDDDAEMIYVQYLLMKNDKFRNEMKLHYNL